MKPFKLSIFLILTLYYCPSTYSIDLKIKVMDVNQQPVEYAVIYINEVAPKSEHKTVTVDQVDKEFIPYVTVVQRGSDITFPNNDNIRHQVYSFSPSKQFELPLYSGNAIRPVTFDNNGAVAMACNIHDWMKAYVYVVDTDKFVISNGEGEGVITDLTNGEYEVLLWHPKLKTSVEATAQQIVVNNKNQQLSFTVKQKKQLKAWRAPKSISRRSY